MRVCLDTTSLFGQRTGVGRYVQHLLEALAELAPEHGLELSATAFTWRGMKEIAAELPSGVELSSRRAPARALQAMWMRGEWPPFELLAKRCDIVHATGFVLPPLRRTRGVVTIHDLAFIHHRETVGTRTHLYDELVPRSIARAEIVCTPTRHVADDLTATLSVPADKIVVTPLGVDDEWSAAQPDPELRHRLSLPSEYVLFVGTLEPRKNLARLLDAYRTNGSSLPPLVIVGGHGWGERLDVSGIPTQQLHFTGYLAQRELRSLVAGATLLTMPSIDEGFGLPALEALACGTPVVVSDLPVFREVLGAQARYCDPHSAEAIADALLAGINDAGPTTRAERRAYAALRSWRATAEATLIAYARAMS